VWYEGGAVGPAGGRAEGDGRDVDEFSGTRDAVLGAVDGEARVNGCDKDGTLDAAGV
jgi:hypothetical protein